MDAAKYNRQVPILCPTCGHSEYRFETEDSLTVKCTGCERELTREELLAYNQENVEAHLGEIKEVVFKDVQKEVRDRLKKAFGGNKNFRIK